MGPACDEWWEGSGNLMCEYGSSLGDAVEEHTLRRMVHCMYEVIVVDVVGTCTCYRYSRCGGTTVRSVGAAQDRCYLHLDSSPCSPLSWDGVGRSDDSLGQVRAKSTDTRQGQQRRQWRRRAKDSGGDGAWKVTGPVVVDRDPPRPFIHSSGIDPLFYIRPRLLD